MSELGNGVENLIRNSTPVVDVMVRLKKIDLVHLTARDVMCLYSIISRPGMSRSDLADTLGLNAEVNVLSNIKRLTKHGYIEDRRREQQRAVAAMLYVLPAGVEFWESIKP